MLILILALTVGLPFAWFASEFQDRRWLRIVAGCGAIATCFLVAAGVGQLERLNFNAWYGNLSKELIDTTIVELERGDTERLLAELRHLQSRLEPTYENRANYDKLIEEFQLRLDEKRSRPSSRDIRGRPQ